MTRSDVGKGHAEYYQDMAERLAAEIPGAFYVNQFGNPANPLAHEQGTGPEIWEQMDHDVDAVVVGVGSGGTLTGHRPLLRAGRAEGRHDPRRSQGLDPGALRWRPAKRRRRARWLVEGIGEDFVPPNCDLSLVREGLSPSPMPRASPRRASC